MKDNKLTSKFGTNGSNTTGTPKKPEEPNYNMMLKVLSDSTPDPEQGDNSKKGDDAFWKIAKNTLDHS